jgi:hypothetical protein
VAVYELVIVIPVVVTAHVRGRLEEVMTAEQVAAVLIPTSAGLVIITLSVFLNPTHGVMRKEYF